MTLKTNHMRNIMIVSTLTLFLLPLHIQQTSVNSTNTSIAPLKTTGLSLSIAEARCGTACKQRKAIRKAWSKFVSKGGTSLGAGPAFGGTIASTILCNGSTPTRIAFMQIPVAGPAGPFAVSPSTGDLYANFSVMPGKYELGNAPSNTTCTICLSVACVTFDVKKVTDPGMGTS